MAEDRSLDEFVHATGNDDPSDNGSGGDDDGPDESVDERGSADDRSAGVNDQSEGADDTDAETTADDPDAAPSDEGPLSLAAVDPAGATSTWTTDGADCDRCGDTVTRRWTDDGTLVCPDCKEW